MLFWCIVFICLFFLIHLIKKARVSPDKGELGEQQVRRWLAQLPKDRYHCLDNVTLPTIDGTTQIDHIVISRYGVFVIETKYRSGLIAAHGKEKEWQQALGGQSYSFQNPLHQNYKHLQTLKHLLNLNEGVLFSLVVFVGNAEFKTPLPEGVVLGKKLIAAIRRKHKTLLTESQRQELTEKINRTRLKPSKKTDQQHKAHVEKLVQAKQFSEQQNLQAQQCCPQCGNLLVLRIAQRGKHKGKRFLACSGFPDCRFISDS